MKSRRAIVVVTVLVVGAAVADAREDAPGAALLRGADSIARDVARIRGLTIKRPIKRGVKTRDQLRSAVLANVARETTPDEIESEARVLKRMRLLGADVDYQQLYVDLATEQIAGFYDPHAGELYLTADIELAGTGLNDGRVVLAHEITHALQDQHFDLQKWMDLDESNGDALAARSALVEGGGMALMIEFLFDRAGLDPPWGDPDAMRNFAPMFELDAPGGDNLLGKAPLFLQMGLMFPYAKGFRFVVEFRTHHPWSRIDAIYRKPPLSTEHILHPETYEAYERPDEIEPRPIKALEDRVEIYRNVSGEMGMSTMWRQLGITKSRAFEAAEGWGGDMTVAYAPTPDDGHHDSLVVASYSVWDDEADAREAYDAMTGVLTVLATGGKTVRFERDHLVVADGGGAVTFATRRRDAVLLVVGVPSDRADAVRDQIFARWRVNRR